MSCQVVQSYTNPSCLAFFRFACTRAIFVPFSIGSRRPIKYKRASLCTEKARSFARKSGTQCALLLKHAAERATEEWAFKLHCVTSHKSLLKPPQASTPTDLISVRSQVIRRIEVFDIHRLIRRASFTSSKEVGPLVLRHLPLHPLFIFFFFVNEFREKRGLQPCTRRRFCYVAAALRDVDRNTHLTSNNHV